MDGALGKIAGDALFLDKFAWERRSVEKKVIPAEYHSIVLWSMTSQAPRPPQPIRYSDNLTIALDGTYEFADPVNTVTVGYDSYQDANILKGKYFELNYTIYKAGTDDVTMEETTVPIVSTSVKFNAATFSVEVTRGEWELLMAGNSDGYPHSGISNGYEYEYVGRISENLFGARVETGSYIGTGVYGLSNPNSLAFGFKPKLLCIRVGVTTAQLFVALYGAPNYSMWLSNVNSGKIDYGTVVNLDTAVSWYSTTAEKQFNTSDTKYYYVAIG